MSRVLLLSCSQRKRASTIPIAAGKLYTGVFYQVVAKARRECRWPDEIVIGIISAEHGFVEEHSLLLPYERKMDFRRAHLLQPEIGIQLDAFLSRQQPAHMMIAMGAPYRFSIARSRTLATLNAQGLVSWAHGGLGEQLHAVRHWIDTPSYALH